MKDNFKVFWAKPARVDLVEIIEFIATEKPSMAIDKSDSNSRKYCQSIHTTQTRSIGTRIIKARNYKI